MHALKQTISAVGAPLLLAEFRDDDGHAVAVCHWRHGDVRYEVRSSDALRVGMNLGGTFKGSHKGAGQSTAISGTPGAVGVFAPGASCETTGNGEIDVVEIYMDARGLEQPVWGWSDLPPLDCADEAVRSAAVATFVAARAGDGPRSRRTAVALRRAANRFYLSRAHFGGHLHRGGLRSTARRRIERLIESRLNAPLRCALDVGELAAAAGLSVSHFIRAFRQTAGTTPHQHVMACRHQRAMALLSDPGLSVAEVADSVGFSSPAHFVASFRTRLGVTPGAYREAVLSPGVPAGALRLTCPRRSGPTAMRGRGQTEGD